MLLVKIYEMLHLGYYAHCAPARHAASSDPPGAVGWWIVVNDSRANTPLLCNVPPPNLPGLHPKWFKKNNDH